MACPFKRTVEKTTETMPLVPKTPATAIFLDQKIQFMGTTCLFFSLDPITISVQYRKSV